MLIISHRGNLVGSDLSSENTIEQVEKALASGFDVEIDLWRIQNTLYLGHDLPMVKVSLDWLDQHRNFLWIHCKNIEAFEFLDASYSFNLFVHEDEPVVITTKGYRWYYPGHNFPNGICVMPEKNDLKIKPETLGVCTDFPIKFQSIYNRPL